MILIFALCTNTLLVVRPKPAVRSIRGPTRIEGDLALPASGRSRGRSSAPSVAGDHCPEAVHRPELAGARHRQRC